MSTAATESYHDSLDKTLLVLSQRAKRVASIEQLAVQSHSKDRDNRSKRIRQSLEAQKAISASLERQLLYKIPVLGRQAAQKRKAELARIEKVIRSSAKKIELLEAKIDEARKRLSVLAKWQSWFAHNIKIMKSNPLLTRRTDAGILFESFQATVASLPAKEGIGGLLKILDRFHPKFMKLFEGNLRTLSKLQKGQAPAAQPGKPRKGARSSRKPMRPTVRQKGLPWPGEETKIYLNIPGARDKVAQSRGGRADTKSGIDRGSRIYLLSETDKEILPRFLNVLPRVYRPDLREAQEWRFQDIPRKAMGKNLRNIFVEKVWKEIRSNLVYKRGGRCVICGGRGGHLLEDVYSDAGRGRKTDQTVECHENWSWTIWDVQARIGVQKLESIDLLCHDCHMMFHEDTAIGHARDVAGGAEKVREYLFDRRLSVSGMSPEALEAQLAEENQERQDFDDMVDTWVLDLSHLNQLEDLHWGTAAMVDDQQYEVSPDEIAGIPFITSDGDVYPEKTVDEVGHDLLRRLNEVSKDSAFSF